MSRQCEGCRHPEAARIASLLASGESFRDVAKQVGLSASAIHRHRAHAEIRSAIVRADEILKAVPVGPAHTDVREYMADARRLAEKAESERDYRGALAAVKILTDVALRLEERSSGQPGGLVTIEFDFSAMQPHRLAAPATEPPAGQSDEGSDE